MPKRDELQDYGLHLGWQPQSLCCESTICKAEGQDLLGEELMSLRFNVQHVSYIKSANTWVVDGLLESGLITPGMKATAITNQGPCEITVKSVALVGLSSNTVEPNKFTITIDEPSVSPEILQGSTLIDCVCN